jgi:ferredoxin-NADP reductase
VRNWTISDFPTRDGPKYYRISIKRAIEASAWMHDNCTTGMILSARSPAGRFVLDWTPLIPMNQVYIPAGIVITPMLAMMKAHAAHPKFERVPALWVHVARDCQRFPFQDELSKLSGLPQLERRIYFGCPLESDVQGVHYNYRVRPDAETLKAIVGTFYNWRPLGAHSMSIPAKMSTFYVCGPPEFEATMRECLKGLEVPPTSIHSESFSRSGAAVGDLKQAKVRFSRSNVSATWTKESPVSLLELAESLGLTPEYGCRVGVCVEVVPPS